ncbi:MAG: DJ-1/PfpI family protein [Rhodocyclaceae bacterium]
MKTHLSSPQVVNATRDSLPRDTQLPVPGIGKGKTDSSHPFVRVPLLFATGERFTPRARIAAQDAWCGSDEAEHTFVVDDDDEDILVGAMNGMLDDDEVIDLPLHGQHVALLAADGVEVDDVSTLKEGLEAAGARVSIIAPSAGVLAGIGGVPLVVNYALADVSSDMFDAICVPGGEESIQVLERSSMALAMLVEAYRQRKTVALLGESAPLLEFIVFCASSTLPDDSAEMGVIVASSADDDGVLRALIGAMYQHWHWSRRVEYVFA